jgi:hypothetical protein
VGASSEGLVFCEQNGRLFAMTEEGRRIDFNHVEKQVAPLPIFQDGLAAVRDKRSAKCGYINRHGEWIIPPRFEQAGEFYDGLAMVFDCDAKRTYRTTDGKRTLARLTLKNPVYGIITRTGEILRTLPVEEVSTNYSTPNGWPNDLFEFIGKVKQGRRSLVPCIVTNFTQVQPFDGVRELRPSFRGLVGCLLSNRANGAWQLRTTRNTVFSKEPFAEMGFWHAGLCPVKASDRGWGAINVHGEKVIPPQYETLIVSRHGLAVGEESGRSLVITPGNSVVLEIKADTVDIAPERIVAVIGDRVLLFDFRGRQLHEIRVD